MTWATLTPSWRCAPALIAALVAALEFGWLGARRRVACLLATALVAASGQVGDVGCCVLRGSPHPRPIIVQERLNHGVLLSVVPRDQRVVRFFFVATCTSSPRSLLGLIQHDDDVGALLQRAATAQIGKLGVSSCGRTGRPCRPLLRHARHLLARHPGHAGGGGGADRGAGVRERVKPGRNAPRLRASSARSVQPRPEPTGGCRPSRARSRRRGSAPS